MKNDDFEITKDAGQEVTRFIVKGQVNSINSPDLEYQLVDAIKNGQVNIVMKMTNVTYLSSIGVRIILKIYKMAKEAGGKLSIELPSENVKNVLGIAALDELMIH